jgi:large subunit ribosomal protein L13
MSEKKTTKAEAEKEQKPKAKRQASPKAAKEPQKEQKVKKKAASEPVPTATAKEATPKEVAERPILRGVRAGSNKKSFILKDQEVIHQWFILDASGKTLGRFASEVTKILRGKHKPTFTTFADGGDGVIVINAEKIRVTGAKEAQKIYRYYTGSMSGMREIPYRTMKARKPAYILEHAIKGMMPKTRLARQQYSRLRVFAGPEHGMAAQKPIQANI